MPSISSPDHRSRLLQILHHPQVFTDAETSKRNCLFEKRTQLLLFAFVRQNCSCMSAMWWSARSAGDRLLIGGPALTTLIHSWADASSSSRATWVICTGSWLQINSWSRSNIQHNEGLPLRRCFNAEPMSKSLAQHWNNIPPQQATSEYFL